jgi:hypothetical protein
MMQAAKEAALGEKVNFLRDAWVAAGKPEYQFWAAMMEIYTGTFPAAKINEAA